MGLHCHQSVAEAERLAVEIEASRARRRSPSRPGQYSAVEGSIRQCTVRLGAPTCLINNASMFVYDDIATLDPQTWDAQLAVNLRAPVFLAKAFAAALPAGVGGNIINMIDQRVWKPTPHFFSYAASKAALWSATRTLAQALAPRIRVNAIGPGPVLPSAHQTDEEFRLQCEATILRARHDTGGDCPCRPFHP